MTRCRMIGAAAVLALLPRSATARTPRAMLTPTPALLPAVSGTPLPQMSLPDCIAIALQNHPSIKAAQANVQAGQARIWEQASRYLPQVNGNYTATRRRNFATQLGVASSGSIVMPGITPTPGISRSQLSSFYTTGVSFSQILFDFGQTLNQIRAAQASEQSLQADAETQRETVILNVQQSYYNLLATVRLLAVADETVRADQAHLDQAQGRYDVGVAAKFDVTQAQVQLANARLNQLTARNNVRLARETLRNALGLTAPLTFDLVDTLEVNQVSISEGEAVSTALAQRPDLQSIRAQELAQTEQVAALEKNYLPNITSNGQYNYSGSTFPLQETWNVGASVNISVFNGGLTTAQVGEAKAILANLKYSEETLKQNIELQVRQAVLNLQQALESIDVAREGLRQARENLDLAEGRYRTGVGNIIELTDAQSSLVTAEANFVQALYNQHTAAAALANAVGRPFMGLGMGD